MTLTKLEQLYIYNRFYCNILQINNNSSEYCETESIDIFVNSWKTHNDGSNVLSLYIVERPNITSFGTNFHMDFI